MKEQCHFSLFVETQTSFCVLKMSAYSCHCVAEQFSWEWSCVLGRPSDSWVASISWIWKNSICSICVLGKSSREICGEGRGRLMMGVTVWRMLMVFSLLLLRFEV